jgi:hypothetical protein
VNTTSAPVTDYVPAVGDVVEFVKCRIWTSCIVGNKYTVIKVRDDEGDIYVLDDDGDQQRLNADGVKHISSVAQPSFHGTYEERQKQWVEHHGLKVGDKVKVVHEFTKGEQGYKGEDWDSFPNKAEMQGKLITLSYIEESRVESINFHFPYFALEPVTS